MNIETLVVGSMTTNCYLVPSDTGTIIVDPGDDAEYIMSHLPDTPSMIIATHGHFDHIMAAYAIQLAYNIPFYLHEADVFLLSNMQSSAKHFLGLKDIDPPPAPSKLPDIPFIHTPGHTPGSICLQFNDSLIVGDTMFKNGVGRTDFSYSEPLKLSSSIQKILSYSSNTRVLPGHGEPTTVGEERTHFKLTSSA